MTTFNHTIFVYFWRPIESWRAVLLKLCLFFKPSTNQSCPLAGYQIIRINRLKLSRFGSNWIFY